MAAIQWRLQKYGNHSYVHYSWGMLVGSGHIGRYSYLAMKVAPIVLLPKVPRLFTTKFSAPKALAISLPIICLLFCVLSPALSQEFHCSEKPCAMKNI